MTTAHDLTKRGIAASNAGNTLQAANLFRQAIQVDPTYEMAWLWLSSVVINDAEKRYCLDQALAINPQSAVAKHGLEMLPAGIVPCSPFPTEQEINPQARSVHAIDGSTVPHSAPETLTDDTSQGLQPAINTLPSMLNAHGASKMSKTQINVVIALLCVGVGLMVWNIFFKPAPRWEYRTVSFMTEGHDRTDAGAMKFTSVKIDDAQMASLGAEGWELVSTYLEMETAYPNFGNADYVTGLQPNVRPQEAVFIFKRQIK